MAKAAFDKIAGGLSEAAEIAKRDAYTTRLREELDRVTRERDEALAYVKDATVAITELTSGGSEFFGKRIAGIYTADLPFCVQRIRETRAGLFEQVRQSKRERQAAEAALAEASQYDVRKMSAPDIAVALPGSEHDRLKRICERAFGAYKQGKEIEALQAALAKRDEEAKAWTALALHLRRCVGAEGDSVWHRVHKSVTPEEALADLKATLTKEPTNA